MAVKRDGPGRAIEQLSADLQFQCLHLLTDSGWGQTYGLGSLCKSAVLSYRDEGFELPRIQTDLPRIKFSCSCWPELFALIKALLCYVLFRRRQEELWRMGGW
jgi:hypothetical protein